MSVRGEWIGDRDIASLSVRDTKNDPSILQTKTCCALLKVGEADVLVVIGFLDVDPQCERVALTERCPERWRFDIRVFTSVKFARTPNMATRPLGSRRIDRIASDPFARARLIKADEEPDVAMLV